MAKLTDVTGRPHSGLVSYPVVALVVDNVDPERLGRIKVKFPTLHQEPLSFWIRQSSPNAGKERGLYALPEVDDEVLVVFLQGSQDVGVIIGQFWNGVDKPPTEAMAGLPGPGATDTGATWSTDQFNDGSKDIDKNDRRFWRSRSGHLLVFDDTEGNETVQMWDGGHVLSFVFDTQNKRIILANTEGDIHIRTKQDLYLEAGRDIKYHAQRDIFGKSDRHTDLDVGQEYTFKAGMNAKHQTGQSFEITANMNIKGNASMSVEWSGSVSFKASGGASTEVSGGASTAVKGGIVLIN